MTRDWDAWLEKLHEEREAKRGAVAVQERPPQFAGIAANPADSTDKELFKRWVESQEKNAEAQQRLATIEEERRQEEVARAKQEDADRNEANKTAGKEANAEKDQAKGESKLAEAWGKVKSGAGVIGNNANPNTGSTISLLVALGLAVFCYWLKLRAPNTMTAFMADFIMLLYCWSIYGKQATYVFMISFFVPVFAAGIVSGEGVPVWTIVLVVVVFSMVIPQIRQFLRNKFALGVELTFIVLTITAYLTNVLHLSQNWPQWGGVSKDSLWGSFLYPFTNQFLNITWIFYIGALKNTSNRVGATIIRVIVFMIAFVFIAGGPATAAGMSLPGVNSPLVTEEGKQQLNDIIENGRNLFNGVPVMDQVYAGIAGLFSIVTNVPIQAQAMANTIAPSQAADTTVVQTGLELAPSEYSKKTFGVSTSSTPVNVYADFQITESQKIQDKLEFVKTRYKLDINPWTDCRDTKGFFLYYPESTEFRCVFFAPRVSPPIAATTCEEAKCPEGATPKGSECCTTAADSKEVCEPLPDTNVGGCLTLGSHSVRARAAYNMATSSSYTPVFVNKVKRIAAEKGGESVLTQCGLQEYAMPVATYVPSNSPVALGITLSQKTMPVVVGLGLTGEAPAPLTLLVSLKGIHNGYISKVKDNGLTVTLPAGLLMKNTADPLLCDFTGSGGTYTGRPKVLSNPEKGEVISYRCQLEDIVGALETTLLGDALCTPVTITANAEYEFTLQTSTSIEIVRPENSATT
ncbi:MAG: hypothetical protein V1702_02685 [Candidatus Woesearchaeota archaeon]